MKRSEMVLNIASELVREESDFLAFDKCLVLAEHILNRIEKDGMLPPFGISTEEQNISDRWGVTDFNKTETVRVIKPIWDSEID